MQKFRFTALVSVFLATSFVWASGKPRPENGAAFAPTALAEPDDRFKEPAYSDVLPAFLVDHVGFDLPADDTFRMEGIDLSEPIFPLISATRHGKPLGIAVIPSSYLNLAAQPVSMTQSGGETSIFINTVSYRQRVNDFYAGPETRFMAAQRQLRQAGYAVKFLPDRGVLLGADPAQWEVDDSAGSSTSIGLSFSYSGNPFSRKKRLTENRDTVIGLGLSLSQPTYNLGGGLNLLHLNLANPFQTGDFYGKYLKRVSVNDLSVAAIRNTEYLRSYLSLNADPRRFSDGHLTAVIPAAEMREVTAPVSIETSANVGIFSDEVKAAERKLESRLETEEQWRQRVSSEVDHTLVVADEPLQTFIQGICDRMADAISMPRAVWPRCRVAASLVPAAYAYPGGDVFITAGLLGSVESLDALYFVLGHQIGHVIGRHTSRQMPYWDSITIPASVLAVVGSAYALPSRDRLKAGIAFTDWFPKGGQDREQRIRDFGAQLFLKSIVSTLIMHSPAAHAEAQRIGDELATASGADPASLRLAWAEAYSAFSVNPEGAAFFRPEDAERASRISARVARLESLLESLTKPGSASRLSTEQVRTYRVYFEHYRELRMAHDTSLLVAETSGYAGVRDYVRRSLASPAGIGAAYALGGVK